MKWVVAMLRRVGLWRSYTADDIINASTEDASRTFEKSVAEVRQATERRKEGNASLRSAIQNAKMKTSAFGDFEDLVGAQRRKRSKG